MYITLALISLFIWSLASYFDKFLVVKYQLDGQNRISHLMVISSLLAGVVMLPITLYINRNDLMIASGSSWLTVATVLSSMTAIYTYFLAYKKVDPDIVTVFHQLIPIFGFVISFVIFKQPFSEHQILGSILVITAALVLAFNFRMKLNKQAIANMILSSFFYAVFFFLFVELSNRNGFSKALLLYQIGLILFGFFLLFNRKIRTHFVAIVIKKPKFLFINLFNQFMNFIALSINNYVMTILPIALVSSLAGAQPAMILVIGLVGFKLFPKLFIEKISNQEIIKLILSIILSAVGIWIMFN